MGDLPFTLYFDFEATTRDSVIKPKYVLNPSFNLQKLWSSGVFNSTVF